MESKVLKVEAYKQDDGKCPFKEWRRSIRDMDTRQTIDDRVDRAALGNVGDCKSVGDGVYELRLHIGAGYRIYFSRQEQMILLLLIGGDKSTQKTDIKTAKSFLEDYESRKSDIK